MNPLDFPGNAVQFEAFNIKPSASKKDDVPYYRLTLEVKKTAWEKFQDATLKGATFAIVCNRVDFDNEAAQAATPITAAEKPAESKPPTGPRCREAIGLVNEPDFWAFMGEQTSYKADKSMKRHITGMVGKEFTSKRQLDTDDGAFFAAFCELKKDYRKWQAANGS